MQYIALDSHKRYTVASVEAAERPGIIHEQRIAHHPGAIRQFLSRDDLGSPVAVETIGHWYWILDEIEAAGMVPQLTHARKAKLMLASANKTDQLDARGLNRLQRSGTLPTVWVPPAPVRDVRELLRARMFLVRQRTQLKNRLHATLAKYGLSVPGVSDLFGYQGLLQLAKMVLQLPPQTRFATDHLLSQLQQLNMHIRGFDRQIQQVLAPDADRKRLQSLPGVGPLLGSVIALEIGDVRRFPSATHLASYAGTTPRVHASGGHVRYGALRTDVNPYLKWAFIEAANVCCLLHRRYPNRHVSRLYTRLAQKRGHPKAIGAVARHLAEATYWVLTKQVDYRDPALSTQTEARTRS
jgi:transposase